MSTKTITVEEAVKRYREQVFNTIADKNPSPIELEMACFARLVFGHRLKGEFCLTMAQLQWDWLYLEKDGVRNYWFTRMVKRMCMEKRVFLVGSSSAGKTFAMSVTGYCLWKSSPQNSTFLVTSTDKQSLDDKIWGTIKDLYDKDKFKLGTRVDHEDAIVFESKTKQRDIRDAIRAIAIPKGSEGEKAIGKVQGRKNQNIIWAADEYDHMDPFVQEARKNLASAPLFVFWASSNKPTEGSPMHQDATPHPDEYPLGWADPEIPEKVEWKVRGGICLYFDGEKSPNTKAAPDKPDPFPMLTRRDYIAGIIEEEGGTDGSGYWRYVKAFPVMGESPDKILTPKVLERFRALEEPVWAGSGWTSISGLDAAWTKGGDDCMADFGKLGVDPEGRKILAHERDAVKLNTKVTARGTVEEQVAEAYIEEAKKRDCHVVAVDISGGGGRVAMAVRDRATAVNYQIEIISVDAAGSPDPSAIYQVGEKRKTAKELFDRRVSELWYSYRISVDQGLIRGCVVTSRAIRELCERRVRQDEKKRWEIEDKKTYKKRNTGKSPDAAEARILCGYAARKHGLGALSETRSVKLPFVEERPKTQAYTHQAPQRRRYSYG
jgi:hypothetical protein